MAPVGWSMPPPPGLAAGDSEAPGDGDGAVVGRGVAGAGCGVPEGLAVGVWSGEVVGGGAPPHAATTRASAAETAMVEMEARARADGVGAW